MNAVQVVCYAPIHTSALSVWTVILQINKVLDALNVKETVSNATIEVYRIVNNVIKVFIQIKANKDASNATQTVKLVLRSLIPSVKRASLGILRTQESSQKRRRLVSNVHRTATFATIRQNARLVPSDTQWLSMEHVSSVLCIAYLVKQRKSKSVSSAELV